MEKSLFLEFKEVTNKIISELENDSDDVLELMERRRGIIEAIVKLEVPKGEKKLTYINLGLGEIDKKLEKAIINKKEEVKREIEKTKKRKMAFSSYAASQRRENLFEKKV